jgi:hypothetical protein
MKKNAFLLVLFMTLISCGRSYHELPFGGMNGKVEKVTEYHIMPEIWFAGFKGTDVMYMNATAYDINGNEICSAVMDSIGRIQAEAENIFENDICVRSTQRAGGRTIAQINFKERSGNRLVYDKIAGSKIIRMVVKENSFLRIFKSTVSEDGEKKMKNIIRINRHGYPVSVDVYDLQAGTSSHEKNTYDENNNLIEKCITRTDVAGKEKLEMVYSQYLKFDEQGNWIEACTYNKNKLPVEVIRREIEYWKQ